MKLGIAPFGARELEFSERAQLDAWRRERISSPLLPPVPRGGVQALRGLLEGCTAEPGVVAHQEGRPVGYLAESRRFAWKGQSAVVCREYAHAVPGPPALREDERSRFYHEMYAALAQTWVDAGLQLHIICHLAGDRCLTETLYRLGFGAVLAENLRDLSPVTVADAAGASARSVCLLDDTDELVTLAREHAGYYRRSPIFLVKDESIEGARREIAASRAAGHALFGLRVEGRLAGYFVVGRLEGDEEGALLAGTNTAQIKSAYIQPDQRGRGAGRALLDACVTWARERGYERLFVEHETANIPGAAFWRKHFAPYLYVSMRYVDGACGLP